MKVTAVKTFPVLAGWRDWVFVKIETDEGISGWGEATLLGYSRTVEGAVHDLVNGDLIGMDPRNIELHWYTLFRNTWFRPSIVLLSALGGVEMALWDILGKSLNVPVYQLLGGAFRQQIQVYNNTWYFSAKTIEDYATLAKRAVSDGSTFLKWDPFWGCDVFPSEEEIQRAKECVGLVRSTVGDHVELLIEMHGRFSPHDAIRIARELEPFRPFWLEEPIPSQCGIDSLEKVAQATSIPIAGGEKTLTRWQFLDLIKSQVLKFVQPDITYCGGISEVKKIANLAEIFYIRVAPHSASGPLLAAANLHLDASIPNFSIQEFFYPDLGFYQEILMEPFPAPKNGFIQLPSKPGLGVEPNEDIIRTRPFEYPKKPLHGGHYTSLEKYGYNK